MSWIQIDDDTYAQEPSPDPQKVVRLSELKQKQADLLKLGVKDEPDAETLDMWNRMMGHEQQKMLLDQIENDIIEIEALNA